MQQDDEQDAVGQTANAIFGEERLNEATDEKKRELRRQAKMIAFTESLSQPYSREAVLVNSNIEIERSGFSSADARHLALNFFRNYGAPTVKK